MTLFIIMTGARAAMLGTVAGLAFYVFFHIRSRWAVAAFGVVSLVVVGLGTLPPQGSTLYRLHVNVDQARIDLWKNAWKLAKYDHFLGRGEKQFETGRGVLRACCPAEHPGHWEDILDAPSDSPEYYQNISFHNQIVQALVEYGLPGAAIMAVFLFFPFVCSIGKSWHLSVSGRYAMGIGLWVAFIVHNMFELGLYNSSAILMGFLAGYTGLFSDRGQRCDTNSVVQRDANA
ncbi:O-antigen ligase domain-containing protein [Candidatus Parcubacteria bacterium]|nr:MAG: O-antigen ligase domain-containing protein [Candidatus Parcubacteria bacterium]